MFFLVTPTTQGLYSERLARLASASIIWVLALRHPHVLLALLCFAFPLSALLCVSCFGCFAFLALIGLLALLALRHLLYVCPPHVLYVGMLTFLTFCLFSFALFCVALLLFAFYCVACLLSCLLDVALFMLFVSLADDFLIIVTFYFEWKANVNLLKISEDVIDEYEDDFDESLCFASCYVENVNIICYHVYEYQQVQMVETKEHISQDVERYHDGNAIETDVQENIVMLHVSSEEKKTLCELMITVLGQTLLVLLLKMK